MLWIMEVSSFRSDTSSCTCNPHVIIHNLFWSDLEWCFFLKCFTCYTNAIELEFKISFDLSFVTNCVVRCFIDQWCRYLFKFVHHKHRNLYVFPNRILFYDHNKYVYRVYFIMNVLIITHKTLQFIKKLILIISKATYYFILLLFSFF